jgi:hypothetical protein
VVGEQICFGDFVFVPTERDYSLLAWDSTYMNLFYNMLLHK